MEKLPLTCISKGDKETTKTLWEVWNQRPKYQLPGNDNWLIGYSWAALRTNFIIGKIMLDAGLSCNLPVDYIFLTHGHSDHSASLYYHLLAPCKVKVYIPEEIKHQVERFLLSHFEISVPNVPFNYETAGYELIGVNPSDQFEIINNGKKHRVTVYDNDHSVPCRSFGFEEEVKSLKDEYRGLPGKELGALRKQGIELETFSWVPRYLYIGDTSELFFEMNPDVFKYPLIMVECTFLYDDDLSQAALTKHCHWKSLNPIISNHTECKFILYHFSTRYKVSDIHDYFQEHAHDMNNVIIWTNQ